MLNFVVTPETIIENAKNMFLSEMFSESISLLQDSFPEDVDISILLDLLKGNIGYSVSGDDVTFGEEFKDEDYSNEINEVLENYDFLFKTNDSIYQVTSFFDFDLTAISQTNSFIEYLNSINLTLVETKSLRFNEEINKIISELGFVELYYYDYLFYSDKRFYLIEKYKNKNIKEICKFYEPIEAVKAYSLSFI